MCCVRQIAADSSRLVVGRWTAREHAELVQNHFTGSSGTAAGQRTDWDQDWRRKRGNWFTVLLQLRSTSYFSSNINTKSVVWAMRIKKLISNGTKTKTSRSFVSCEISFIVRVGKARKAALLLYSNVYKQFASSYCCLPHLFFPSTSIRYTSHNFLGFWTMIYFKQ